MFDRNGQQTLHLSSRFGLLFYNDRIVIPENMRTTVKAMLHHGHTSAAKMEQLSVAFWCPGIQREIQEKADPAQVVEPQVRTLLHKFRQRKKKNLEF